MSKFTFGAEPKDSEVYYYILKNYNKLKFSADLSISNKKTKRINPKRNLKIINRQLKNTGIGTKSQQALNLQKDLIKTERKVLNREKREAEKERKFLLNQQKRKKKHRGH